MKKIIWLPVLSVCVVILWILCASCSTPTDTEEKWSLVTSLDQLNGTWKGTYKQTMPVQEAAGSLGQAGNDMDGMIALLGDMKAKVSAETTTTINAKVKTKSGSVKTTITFSGENINYTWGMMQFFLMAYFPDAVFNDKNHSMTMTQDIPEEPLTDEEIEVLLSSGLKINQNGKKIKIPAGAIAEGFSGGIPPGMITDEITLKKQ